MNSIQIIINFYTVDTDTIPEFFVLQNKYFFITLSKDCNFAYVGESKHCWASRSIEHDPAYAASKESAIWFHAERTDHDIHPWHAYILKKNVNYYGERMFLESLHSQLEKNTVNERKPFPRAYIPLLRTLGKNNSRQSTSEIWNFNQFPEELESVTVRKFESFLKLLVGLTFKIFYKSIYTSNI